MQCSVLGRKYCDDLLTVITLQTGGWWWWWWWWWWCRAGQDWLAERHYTKNLYLYNVSITASSTLASNSTTTQMGAEKMFAVFLTELLCDLTGRMVKSYEATLIRSKVANYKR